MNVCTALMLLASLGNVSASFILQETFSAAGCAAADKKKDDYTPTDTCLQQSTYYVKFSCSGSSIITTGYKDKTCTTANSTYDTTQPMACTVDRSGWKWNKLSCSDAAETVSYSAWTTSNCSGVAAMASKSPYSVCMMDAEKNETAFATVKSKKGMVSGSNYVEVTYTTADCSGTGTEKILAPMGPCGKQNGTDVYWTITLVSAAGAATTSVAGRLDVTVSDTAAILSNASAQAAFEKAMASQIAAVAGVEAKDTTVTVSGSGGVLSVSYSIEVPSSASTAAVTAVSAVPDTEFKNKVTTALAAAEVTGVTASAVTVAVAATEQAPAATPSTDVAFRPYQMQAAGWLLLGSVFLSRH